MQSHLLNILCQWCYCTLLIAHFDIWMEKWNDLANSKFFKLEEEFSFENSFTFPKEAAKNLEKEFLKFREKIS